MSRVSCEVNEVLSSSMCVCVYCKNLQSLSRALIEPHCKNSQSLKVSETSSLRPQTPVIQP